MTQRNPLLSIHEALASRDGAMLADGGSASLVDERFRIRLTTRNTYLQQKKNNNKRLITHVSYPIADQVLRHHMMHTESNLYTPNGCTHTRKTLHIREKLGAPLRHVHLLRERERKVGADTDAGKDGGLVGMTS